MGAISGLIWFVAIAVGGVAVVLVLGILARSRYIASGQEEGE